MNERDHLAERFEKHRTHLRAVAYRMLGSVSEVDDAVQEAWLRLSRAETAGIDNLGGWLTTVVACVCLDMLRSRESRREQPFTADAPEPVATGTRGSSPEPSPRTGRPSARGFQVRPGQIPLVESLPPIVETPAHSRAQRGRGETSRVRARSVGCSRAGLAERTTSLTLHGKDQG